MAANEATELVEDKEIIVLPTKTIPQGIVALVNYIPDYSAEENKEMMLSELGSVKTGQVTYAVRDTEIDGMVIHENDIMGIGDHKMLAVGTEVNATAVEMIDKMIEESDAELISIYYGADVTKEAAEALADLVSEAHGDCDVELQYGGQPVYYYIVSAE